MAVYTHVSDEQLNDFLKEYELGEATSFKGIAEGVENTNFLLQTEKGRYILTLYEKRVNSGDLPYFLSLIDHLAKGGIICPTPVANRKGSALGTCAGRPAALFTFLEGMSLRRPAAEHCGALGAAMASFHKCGQSFELQRQNSFSLPGMQRFYETIEGDLSGIDPDLETLIEAELEELQKAWPAGLPEGVIHADLFPDNVFFLGNRISGLIDFYFACTDFLMLDLAITINAWCFEPDGSFNVTKASRLLASYHEIRPITRAEIDALPIIARAAALRFLLTRTHDWLMPREGALVARKDPLEYLRKLKFHRTIENPNAYGLSNPL